MRGMGDDGSSWHIGGGGGGGGCLQHGKGEGREHARSCLCLHLCLKWPSCVGCVCVCVRVCACVCVCVSNERLTAGAAAPSARWCAWSAAARNWLAGGVREGRQGDLLSARVLFGCLGGGRRCWHGWCSTVVGGGAPPAAVRGAVSATN